MRCMAWVQDIANHLMVAVIFVVILACTCVELVMP